MKGWSKEPAENFGCTHCFVPSCASHLESPNPNSLRESQQRLSRRRSTSTAGSRRSIWQQKPLSSMSQLTFSTQQLLNCWPLAERSSSRGGSTTAEHLGWTI